MTKILIVEDDVIVANNLKDRLGALGHRVCGIAVTGPDAISEVAGAQPDLILMDIKLRGAMDGITAAEEIRSRFDVPLVFLTGYADSATLQRAKLANPYGYILKPFEVRDLHTSIEMALHSHAVEKRLRESEENYRTLVENSLQAIMVIRGMPPKIVFANARCSEITGYSLEELHDLPAGKTLRFLHPEDRDRLSKRWQRYLSGRLGPTRDEFRALHRDGTVRWLEYFASQVKSDGQEAMQLAIIDITKRREAEAALLDAHAELEVRVEQRTAELAEANQQLTNEILIRMSAEESLKGLNRELAILNALGQQVSASLSLDEVVQATLRIITERLAPDLSMVFVLEEDGLQLRGLYPLDSDWQDGDPGVHRVGECLCGLAVSQKEPMLSDNINLDARCTLEECKAAGMSSFAALPLLQGEEVLGVLGLASAEPQAFAPHAAFLSAVANTVAVGLQNALLHQRLRHHAADLEKENLDRTLAEEALRNSEERYRILFEQNLAGVYRSTIEGQILECNEAFARILGYDTCEEILSLPAKDAYLAASDRQDFISLIQANGSLTGLEWCMKRKDGSPVWCLENASLTKPLTGESGVIQGTLFDITDRKRMEQALAENEEKYRSLFSNIPLCIFEVDLSQEPHTILQFNRMATDVYGWSAQELFVMPANALFATGEFPNHQHLRGEIMAGRMVSMESRHLRKDGTIFPVRFSASPISTEVHGRIILAVEDITAEVNRRSEEEAIGEERRRIAREIHDGLAQNLASLRFQARLWHRLIDQDPDQMHIEVETMRELLRSQIQDVRRSIFALRPIALDELGLYQALNKFSTDFGEQNQIQIELHIQGPKDRLPSHLEPVLFRIVQESLNNVRKHAGADKVWISLDLQRVDTLTLVMRDNGRGFELKTLDDAVRYGHLGLQQMRERVEELQGQFQLESQPGEGTTTRVVLPTARM